jgi:hypothetical protein
MATRSVTRREREGSDCAERHHASQRRGRADAEVQHLSAIRLQQHILQRERKGADADGGQQARRARRTLDEGAPRLHERTDGALPGARGREPGVARFLLPDGEHVQQQGQLRDTLQHLNEPDLPERAQQPANPERAHHHAHQQHHVQQGDDARLILLRCDIRGERQPGGLHHVRTDAGTQERHEARGHTNPGLSVRVTGQQQQRHRHDRESAELQQRAKPDVRHAPPTQDADVGIASEADEGAQRRSEQRQREHQPHRQRGQAKLHDHDAIQRPRHERHGHRDRDLEQAQAQQSRQRQFRGGDIRERQHPWPELGHEMLHESRRRAHVTTPAACARPPVARAT